MKRDGRMHGTNLRLSRQAWVCERKVPSKPTSQSRCTAKLPCVSNFTSNIIVTEHECPSYKSLGKTKGAFKAKDLDITRNYLIQDWKFYQSGNQLLEDDSDLWEYQEIAPGPASCDQDDDMADWDNRHCSSEMVLPIESLLSKRKGTRHASTMLGPSLLPLGLDEDSDDTWCGLDAWNSEDVIEDWFLVSQAE